MPQEKFSDLHHVETGDNKRRYHVVSKDLCLAVWLRPANERSNVWWALNREDAEIYTHDQAIAEIDDLCRRKSEAWIRQTGMPCSEEYRLSHRNGFKIVQSKS